VVDTVPAPAAAAPLESKESKERREKAAAMEAGANTRPLLGSTYARFVGYGGSLGAVSDNKRLRLS